MTHSRKVFVYYSTYSNSMQILVDDNTIDSYSHLYRYMDRPFYEWCSEILEALYKEVRSAYELHFCASQQEIEIMRKLASECIYCKKFIPISYFDNRTLVERSITLSKLIAQNNIVVTNVQTVNVIFISSRKMIEIHQHKVQQLDIKNSFCKFNFHVKEFGDKCGFDGIHIYLVDNIEDAYKIAKCRQNSKYNFAIVFSSENKFINIINRCFIWTTRDEDYFETVFKCILLVPLKECLCFAVNSILKNTTDLDVRFRVQMLLADRPILQIAAESVIEVNKSTPLHISTTSSDGRMPDLIFRCQVPGIVECTPTRIYALKPGTTKVYISERGSANILKTLHFDVVSRNRITDLVLSHSSCILGEGDSFQLEWECIPNNADNISEVKWNVYPSSVATVINGLITAHAQGECRIVCSAETVASECFVTVLPYLSRLSLPQKLQGTSLKLRKGEEYILELDLEPTNAYDSKLIFSSSNLLVANISKNKILAVDNGHAKVTIENITHRFRHSIDVIVTD